MYRKFLSFILIFILIFNIVACNFGTGEENTEPPIIDDEDDFDSFNSIYGPKSPVVVIRSESDKTSDTYSITSKIHNLSGRFAVVEMDSSSKKDREIVIGLTSREISSTAAMMLNKSMENLLADYESEGKYNLMLKGFAIYSVGKSLAIVWSDSEISQTAIEYFAEKYIVESTLVLDEEHYEFVAYDGVDTIIEQQTLAKTEAYEKVVDMYGEETLAALEAHLDLFDERFYLWLADLYEKETTDLSGNVIGGGFYYSNSARDNESYAGVSLLPDLESTYQVLSFLSKSGMLDYTSYTEALPEQMQRQMINFARNLQSSSDGYFYHPQWGKSISTSRLSRDCSWGAVILSRLGVKPYWDTPSGTPGIYGKPSGTAKSSVTIPLSTSKATAVSNVISVSDVWTGSDQLSTLEKWENYLNGFKTKIKLDSYSVGNTISSQNAQIKNRDKLALKTGECKDANGDGIADGGYIETFKRIFDDLQLENGLWESTVSYNSVNGLMKIAGAYSNLGIPIARSEEALSAAVSMITSNASFSGITDVYNPWVATNTLLNNIKNYGGEEKAESLKEAIKQNATEMIRATTEKVSRFAKADGSFSYDEQYSPYKSQGAIVAVRYTNEGDINGGTIAYTGIWSSMCSVLDVDIKPLTFEDFLKFIARVDY